MTKRSRDSIASSSYAEPPDRQASHDAEGSGSHEDGEGSSLKKPRSFMATLVRIFEAQSTSSLVLTDSHRRAISVDRERRDVMKTDQNVVTAGP